jgi:hypothetical protein
MQSLEGRLRNKRLPRSDDGLLPQCKAKAGEELRENSSLFLL